MEEQGYRTEILEQGGQGEQPDMIAKPKDGEREIAFEVEVSTNHPEQIIKNYEKNARSRRFVIFVVQDDEVEFKVKEYLKSVGRSKYRIYKI